MNNEIVSSYRIMKIMYQRNYVTEVGVCISIFLIFFHYFRGFKYINCFFDTLPCLIVAGRVKFHFWTNLLPEFGWKKIPLLGIQTNLTNATLPLDTLLLLGTQGQALVCNQSIWLFLRIVRLCPGDQKFLLYLNFLRFFAPSRIQILKMVLHLKYHLIYLFITNIYLPQDYHFNMLSCCFSSGSLICVTN